MIIIIKKSPELLGVPETKIDYHLQRHTELTAIARQFSAMVCFKCFFGGGGEGENYSIFLHRQTLVLACFQEGMSKIW